MDTRTFLLERLSREALALWGERDAAYLGRVADDWLDTTGQSGSRYRLDRIRLLHPGAGRILDIGAGCGAFVGFALSLGYDAYGIEPENWKLDVVRRAVRECRYERLCAHRIIAAAGEHLPFANHSFDCITTFQTLEHVRDVRACCAEMLRVVRPGGCIHLRCPDYELSTYEGHYRLPWLPGLRGGAAAEKYLSLLGKPLTGLRSLQPVGARMLRSIFKELGSTAKIHVRIVDVDELRLCRLLHRDACPAGYLLSRPLVLARFLRLLFRIDYPVDMAVYVESK